MLKSPLDNKIHDDSSDNKNFINNNYNNNNNNSNENVIYYNSTENLTQTIENQILQTEKNNLGDSDISKNIQFGSSKNSANANAALSLINKNPNKVLLRNLTFESDRKSLFIFLKLIYKKISLLINKFYLNKIEEKSAKSPLNNILKNQASKKNITINIVDNNNTIHKDKKDNLHLNNNYNKILTTKNQGAVNFNRDFPKINTTNASNNDLLRSVKNFDFNLNNINSNNNNNNDNYNNNKNTLIACTSTTNFMNYKLNNFNGNNSNFFNMKSPKNQLSKHNNTNLNNIGGALNIKPINGSATTKNSSTANNSSKGVKEPLSHEALLGMKNSLLASISGMVHNKLDSKKKSQSPIRKEALKSGSKTVI